MLCWTLVYNWYLGKKVATRTSAYRWYLDKREGIGLWPGPHYTTGIAVRLATGLKYIACI